MKVYWSRCGPRYGNFGDKVTPLLLKHFGVRCEWAPPERAELVAVGSILEKVPEDFNGIIWTSGFMHEQSRRPFQRAKILALRGKLTRERVQCETRDAVCLGDAGLLCDIFQPARPKRFQLGIIPHFVDADDAAVDALARANRDVRVIDICGEPSEILSTVAECERIVSSSLHGLIVADSLGIPNRWIELNRGGEPVAGGGFKFRDYYSIYGLNGVTPDTLSPADTVESIVGRFPFYARPGLPRIKEQLLQTLAAITGSQPTYDPEQRRLDEKQRSEWAHRLESVKAVLRTTVGANSILVLADEDQLRASLDSGQIYPFTERAGEYWGPPGDDDTAIQELERLRARRAEFFAVAFPSFWLFERFPRFAAYLEQHWTCTVRSDDVVIFRAR